jgi:hypothetical protein
MHAAHTLRGVVNLKTYVRIYGPPLMEALDELQKIAGGMPKVTHYHFMANYMPLPFPEPTVSGGPGAILPSPAVPKKVTEPLISKSGHTLGDHDFFFEWTEDPSWDQMRELVSKIDKAFTRLGCKYTLSTK